MARRQQFIQSSKERMNRRFSEEFKQKKVSEIEKKLTTIAQVSRQYDVRMNCVSDWVHKYGRNYMKQERVIVESESDTEKIAALKAKVAELERIVGQKQVQLDFKDKMIELAEEFYSVDIKKKFDSKPSSGSGSTEKA